MTGLNQGPDQLQDSGLLQQRIQELEQEVERRTRESYQQGYSAGQAAGTQQAQAQLEPLVARLARTLEELAGLKRRVRAEAEEDAVRLSIAIARKILHREITVDAEALLGLFKAALQRVDAHDVNRVRVNPEDISMIKRHLETGAAVNAQLALVADAGIERGSVIFETTRGNLDASVSTQLVEIENGLVDLVRRSRDAF
jgi:flagellar assembly protein FliH